MMNLSAEAARRKVSVFVGNEIADLLFAESPGLVRHESSTYWHVPVILASRSSGRIGRVGFIDIDVESGELQLRAEVTSEIDRNARILAANAVL